jgi:hypothetical protein
MSSISQNLCRWKPLADALDAKTRNSDLFCEEFSDGVISLMTYVPQTLEIRISVGSNHGGSGYGNTQGNRGPPATGS